MTTTATKAKPILFTGPMVRAIIDGRKSQTRRVIKPEWWRCLVPDDEDDRQQAIPRCPYGAPGDRLYCRESFRFVKGEDRRIEYKAGGVAHEGDNRCCQFRINRREAERDYNEALEPGPCRPSDWRPSIHMPRWASRITLEVLSVRVEKLQDISEADAIAEGVTNTCGVKYAGQRIIDAFRPLWDSINAKNGHGWEANDWVWVVEFKQVEDDHA